MSTPVYRGRCLCGAVTFTVEPVNNEIGVCHCNMCRRWSSGPFMEIDCGNSFKADNEENLQIFDSSEWAERGFCSKCGSSLFYRLKANAVLANADRYGTDPIWSDVRKTVKTDPGKSSKAGIQAVTREGNGAWAAAKANAVPVSANLLEPVYRDGEILRDQTFEEVRANAILA